MRLRPWEPGGGALRVEGYRVLQELYCGGKSLVYQAVREIDACPVVLKLLNQEFPSADAMARFRTEHQFTQRLEGRGIVEVIDLVDDASTLAIVMKDVGGVSLARRLSEKKLTQREFLRLAIGIAEALSEVHAQHVLHKDINPSNVIWNSETGELKIIDFGISAELPREAPQLKSPSKLEGTLPYMSPEQTGRMNRVLDYRTDLYSLGVTFYEMLMGRRPFETDDPMELVHCHIAKSPAAPEDLNQQVPSTLSRLVMKLLSKNAEDRYQTTLGLLSDLRECERQIQTHGRVSDIDLGQHDVSGDFQIPQKLYGREKESAQLLEAFERVSHGDRELVLVKGYSGIGKTALVNEIHKPVVAQRGYFISGKFDQFQRGIPYASLVQAFQSLVRQLLTESDRAVALWKSRLLEALGPNGQVIVDVIPEVALIIGDPPPVAELGPSQSQNRFRSVFQSFMRVFARREHPIVVFLDDLQWVDISSLQLIQAFLTDSDAESLLIIGGYRNKEVQSGHPLLSTLDELRERQVAVSTIAVEPLTAEHTGRLLADALSCTPEEVLPLTELCLEKTEGNPFFLGQFLHTLYEEGGVHFVSSTGRWAWDIEEIRRRDMTDNVVELMVSKLSKLSTETRSILKLAACVGSVFDLKTLSVVNNRSYSETAQQLWESLQQGLIVPTDDAYKYLQEFTQERSVTYRFLHDRVQQAAYSLLGDQERIDVHLQIGRLLLEGRALDARGDVLFDVVNHMNVGLASVVEKRDRARIAELNLEAAQKAKGGAANAAALSFVKQAIVLFTELPDLVDATSPREAYRLASEVTYLLADDAAMDAYVDAGLRACSTPLEEVPFQKIRALAAQSREGPRAAAALLENAIRALGFAYPSNPGRLYFLFTSWQLKRHTRRLIQRNQGHDDGLRLPVMTSPKALALVDLLTTLTTILYRDRESTAFSLPATILEAMRLCFAHGQPPQSAIVWMRYAYLVGFRDRDFGRTMLRLAVSHNDVCGRPEDQCVMTYMRYAWMEPWYGPLRGCLEPLKESVLFGQQHGDLDGLANAASSWAYAALPSGKPLPELAVELRDYVEVAERAHQRSNMLLLRAFTQFVANCRGQTLHVRSFFGDILTPDVAEEAAEKDLAFGFFLELLKMWSGFLSHDTLPALEAARAAGKRALSGFGTAFFPAYVMIRGLLALRAAREGLLDRTKALKRAKRYAQKLRSWARWAPMNFHHKHLLLDAELARMAGDTMAAVDLYTQAIALAGEHQYTQDEAMAHELFAEFWLEQSKEDIAQLYLLKARHGYERWGASAKVSHLDAMYPEFLAARLGTGRRNASRLSTSSGVTDTTSTTSGAAVGVLDAHTVVKAAETIGGEIVLSELLRKLMVFALENAGAERGALILLDEHDRRFWVHAEGEADAKGVRVLERVPLSDFGGASEKIVRFVVRTGEPLVLSDASTQGRFTNDSYVKSRQLMSLLCMPIVHQGKTTGVLYLENNLAAGAFTPDRLEVLKVLSSQASISIENARLYASVQKALADERELKDAFQRFVPHQFLELLEKKSIADVALGEHVEMKMSILFADIRGFTTLSEGMTPAENFAFLNNYFKRMQPAIESHHGFIDKYIGDAIMALFDEGPDDAVQAGIAMLTRLREYNEERLLAEEPPIDIGLGINTGQLMLGTIGGAGRMEGTVISDAVNVASRVEALTKTYGAPLLITDATYVALKDRDAYGIRCIDRVRVKGKREPVTLYEILDGESEKARASKEGAQEAYDCGLKALWCRDFPEAVAAFSRCLDQAPGDKAAQHLYTRAQQFGEEGIPAEWQSIFHAAEE